MRMLLSIMLYCICSIVVGQVFKIPEGKFNLYWERSFLDKCRKATSELPFVVKTTESSCRIHMEHGNLFAHVAVPFILDGDTTLLNYTKIERDEDTGEVIEKSVTWFDFEVIGMFEYKDYWVIACSYPLADPNIYQCYTINTYSKDGKRIDRLPFFKWECEQLSVMDISWFEITGYIYKDFKIIVQTRTSWEDANTGELKGDELKKEQHYSVYHINNKGMFEQVDTVPKYIVDDKNNWRCNK